MIKIRQSDATNLKTKESLYVSFDYDLDLIYKIKSLPQRFFVKKTNEWEIPIRHTDKLISLFSDQELVIEGKVRTDIEDKVNGMLTFSSELDEDFEFKTKPFQHQVECFEYAETHPKFLLGDEQGLGKTKQALDCAVARKKKFKHALIICGVNGLKWNWAEEVKIHTNEKCHILGQYTTRKGTLEIGDSKDKLKDLNSELDAYFLITNIESLRYCEIEEDEKGKAKKVFPIQDKLEELTSNGTIGMVIIDEFHKGMKDPSTIQGKAIHKLKSYFKMALSGTPILNNPLDSYNILKWLDIEQHPFSQFQNRYCITGGYGGYEVLGYKNLNELQEIISKGMLRRKKEDVLDLPPKFETTDYVEMSQVQAKIYKEIYEETLSMVDQIKMCSNPLVRLTRLRQATASTELLTSKFSASAKLDRLEELVEEITSVGGKVIVFSNWEKVVELASNRLEKYNPIRITGSVKDEERQIVKNKFQNDPKHPVILGTIGAMGTGLTLTAGSTVIFLDEPWNKATKDQAEDRAHRVGTKHNVNIVTLLCKGTIDEKIHRIVIEKGAMTDALVDNNWAKMSKVDLLDMLLS